MAARRWVLVRPSSSAVGRPSAAKPSRCSSSQAGAGSCGARRPSTVPRRAASRCRSGAKRGSTGPGRADRGSPAPAASRGSRRAGRPSPAPCDSPAPSARPRGRRDRPRAGSGRRRGPASRRRRRRRRARSRRIPPGRGGRGPSASASSAAQRCGAGCRWRRRNAPDCGSSHSRASFSSRDLLGALAEQPVRADQEAAVIARPSASTQAAATDQLAPADPEPSRQRVAPERLVGVGQRPVGPPAVQVLGQLHGPAVSAGRVGVEATPEDHPQRPGRSAGPRRPRSRGRSPAPAAREPGRRRSPPRPAAPAARPGPPASPPARRLRRRPAADRLQQHHPQRVDVGDVGRPVVRPPPSSDLHARPTRRRRRLIRPSPGHAAARGPCRPASRLGRSAGPERRSPA